MFGWSYQEKLIFPCENAYYMTEELFSLASLG